MKVDTFFDLLPGNASHSTACARRQYSSVQELHSAELKIFELLGEHCWRTLLQLLTVCNKLANQVANYS